MSDGEMSLGESRLIQCILEKYLSNVCGPIISLAQMSISEMLVIQMPVSQMSVVQISV
jgi:hypothetical protein